MTVPIELILCKARGFIDGYDRMNDTERGRFPSEAYANDYNSLRSMIQQNVPDLKELIPPQAQMFPQPSNHQRLCMYHYSDLNVYCSQIAALLSGVIERAKNSA